MNRLADTIYTNGDILTMVDATPTAEALAVADGKILAVGSKDEVMKHRGGATRVVDLGGRTLLPGFIDPHSHFVNALQIIAWANVTAPPVGPVKKIADIIEVLKKHVEHRKVGKGEWILGYGYDGSVLEDGRELTAEDLDAHFPDNPILLIHVSLHGGVLNRLAFQKFNITAETVTPPGGIMLRKPGTNEPAGLVMEVAFLPIWAKVPKPDEAELLERFKDAQEIYASAGITTAQEGMTNLADLTMIQKGAAQGRLYLDVVSYVAGTEFKEILEKNPVSSFGSYSNHLKLGGAKCIFDGSVQGKTGFFSKPYLTGGPTGEEDWRGEPTFPPETLKAMVKAVYDSGLQLILHANGDAAIDLAILAHEEASGGDPTRPRRTAIIHSQFIRPDQMEKYVKYHLIPSFFSEHAFFFSEVHIQNLGAERTHKLSPMKSALAMGLQPTNHTDFCVLPINQMWTVWTAVRRTSRAGREIGPEERVTPWEALRAITINAAYQHFEEDRKGSLEPGKLADLVVLSANPCKVDPDTIKDIQVLETIKEGNTVFQAAPQMAGA